MMKDDAGEGASRLVEQRERNRKVKADAVLAGKIGESIDLLVEYLADNHIEDIHPLVMGEIERRLIVKALERSRGNKLKAARMLGISRNTFHRKLQKLDAADSVGGEPPDA